jgi:hypothetical protein
MSGETDNLLLSVLSGGMVGFGDEQGKENRENLLKAAREDGMLVKPDAAIVPLDESYLSGTDAEAPIIASTFTDRGGTRTLYVFIFAQSKTTAAEAHFRPADLGLAAPVYVYDFFSGTARRLDDGAVFSSPLAANKWSYCIVAPVGKSGIAFLGDQGKFVGTGKQRVASMDDTATGLSVDLIFAASESASTLHGYAPSTPQVSAVNGTAGKVRYDSQTQYFAVEINPDLTKSAQGVGSDPTRHVSVTLQIK